MTDKKYYIDTSSECGHMYINNWKGEHMSYGEVEETLNELFDEVMSLRFENTKFKLVVGDIVDDLEEQAERYAPIIISKEYVEWIKKELDLELRGQKNE